MPVSPAPDATQWTAIILARGEILRGVKAEGVGSVSRSGMTATVRRDGMRLQWTLEQLAPPRVLASGDAFLLMTACTDAAAALVMAEQRGIR